MTDKLIKMPEFEVNVVRPHVQDIMKKTAFVDIETSLIKAYTFRTGMQRINIDQVVEGDQTKLLTAAWGTWHDLYHNGADGVVSVGNHHRKAAFKRDPLDDTYVLKKLWHLLNDSKVIVAHNAAFDKGWIEGRFLDLGWKLPSKYYVFCTFRTLHGLNGNSKKLDYLSQKLIGTKKVAHEGMPLWVACSEGDVSAFEKMEEYNIGDIYDTLYKVFMRTALYAPHKAIDLSGNGLFCKVTGHALEEIEEVYVNRNTGLEYTRYANSKFGFIYRDRYNTRSKKAGLGYVTPLISNGL